MKRLTLLLTGILFCGMAFSQTVIKKQDFEGGTGAEVWEYTSSTPYTGTVADVITENFWNVLEGWILGDGNSGFVARYNDGTIEDTLFFSSVDVSDQGELELSI